MRPPRKAGPRARVAPLALAAAGALVLGGTPALLGTVGAGDDPAELAQFEAGAHAYHADETVAGERRNEAVLDRCESDPAYRAANWESCPASAGPPPASASAEPAVARRRRRVGRRRVERPRERALARDPLGGAADGQGAVVQQDARQRRRRRPRLRPGDGDSRRPCRPPWSSTATARPSRRTSGAAGQAQLPDGRVLVAGGNLAYPAGDKDPRHGNGYKGAAWIYIFDPFTETWERLESPTGAGTWSTAAGTRPSRRSRTGAC